MLLLVVALSSVELCVVFVLVCSRLYLVVVVCSSLW